MTAKEICRKYDETADKEEMIQILADVEGCTKKDIMELLKNNGRSVPVIKKPGQKRKVKKEVLDSLPEVVKEAIADKLDIIDSRIKELEPLKYEYDNLKEQYELLAQYLCS